MLWKAPTSPTETLSTLGSSEWTLFFILRASCRNGWIWPCQVAASSHYIFPVVFPNWWKWKANVCTKPKVETTQQSSARQTQPSPVTKYSREHCWALPPECFKGKRRKCVSPKLARAKSLPALPSPSLEPSAGLQCWVLNKTHSTPFLCFHKLRSARIIKSS